MLWFQQCHRNSFFCFSSSCIVDISNQDNTLQSLCRFLHHIKHLRIVFDQFLEANRRYVARILDIVALRQQKLQSLCIACRGDNPYFYSGQDILQGLRQLCRSRNKLHLQCIDLRKMPFTLDNGFVKLIGISSPDLRTLFINNRTSGLIIIKPKTIAELLRACPKLSTLGLYHASLSEEVFHELLEPNREPFRCLAILCEGLEKDIPEELWTALSQRHPNLQVELELDYTVPEWKLPHILKPHIPVTSLEYNICTDMVSQIQFVASNYSRTLERLVFRSDPSRDLDASLIDLAKKCVHLKEVHCNCEVSQAVREAFVFHCPNLRKYTLPARRSFW